MTGARPRLLLVGGGGGLAGRALVPELARRYELRSIHRHTVPAERERAIEWVPADVGAVEDWAPLLSGVDLVVNLAWYRWAAERQFRKLRDGLLRLVRAARVEGIRRFVHLSVPPAPPEMERTLPYLSYKRQIDVALERSGISYRILAPTMLFGHGDRLLGVMLRLMARYHRFPMFGDGRYHVSPVAASDLAEVVIGELEQRTDGTSLIGGPERLEYRELTDRMFRLLDLPPRYTRLSAGNGRRLAWWLTLVGSTLLYPYEVEWLTSDWLGLPPYEKLGHPLTPLGTYLEAELTHLRDA